MNHIKRSLLLVSFLLMLQCDTVENSMDEPLLESKLETEQIDLDLNLISEQIDAINEELDSDF